MVTNKQGVRDLNGSKLKAASSQAASSQAEAPPVSAGAASMIARERLLDAVSRDEIMEWFAFDHLPEGHMRDTSRLWSALAENTHANLPRCAERSVALRKLLEGKDAAVRAARKLRDAEGRKPSASTGTK